MKWITEWVKAEDADARLAELVADRWFISQVSPVPAGVAGDGDRVFIAAGQKALKKGKA